MIWLVILIGCLKSDDFSDIEFRTSNPILAFSLLETSVSSDDLVALVDSMAVVENDIYELTFEADPYSQQPGDLLGPIQLGLPFPILDTSIAVPIPTIDGLLVRQADLKGESLIFTLNAASSDTLWVEFFLPALELDGVPFREMFVIPPSLSVPSFVSAPISIAGYTLDLSEGLFPISYYAQDEEQQRRELGLSFIQLTGLDFSYVQGNIAQQTIPTGLQSIQLDLPDSLIQGDLTFIRPELKFNIRNSFGIPVGIRVLELYAQSVDGTQQPLTSALFDEVVEVPYPRLSERGDTASQEIILNAANSNIAEVLDPEVRTLFYNVEIVINPASMTTDDFFVSEASIAILEAEVVLPLQVDVVSLSIDYRLPLDIEPIEGVEELRLKLYAENGIPLDFEPKLQFANLGSEVVLQEETAGLVAAAQTDGQGVVVGSTTSELFFEVSASALDLINTADSVGLLMNIGSNQMGNDGVQISPGQVLFLGLGVEAKLQ